jgi:predicted transcriptional regulator
MMTRSATTTGSPLPKNIRHVGSSTAEIVNRIKELEDTNRALRSQNRKQDALVNKYREKWERLKEGAKKRQPSNSINTLLSSLASNTPPVTIDSSLRK